MIKLHPNNLMLCTITGADDRTNPVALDDLSEEFPFLEVGVLLTEDSEVLRPRYPSPGWRAKFQRTYLGQRSFHLCGRYLLDILKDSRSPISQLTEKLGIWRSLGIRIQLNLSSENTQKNLLKIHTFANSFTRHEHVILQLRRDNLELIGINAENELNGDMTGHSRNYHFLLDESGGTGKPIEEFPRIGGVFLGYAGGLGPDNIEETILAINKGGPCNYWLDMETKVRSDDGSTLDIEKVYKVLKTISDMKKAGLA